MAWIPSQDPWGIAMLTSGAAFGVSLVFVNAARMSLRSRTGPMMMVGLATTAFLACAGMGTLERLGQSPTAAAEAQVVDAAAGDLIEDPATSAEPDPPPVTGDAQDNDAVSEAKTAAARNSALDPTPSLPTAGAERQTALRMLLRSARSVYENPKDCKNAKTVGQAWAGVAGIPQDARSARVKAVARKLEGCRKQVRWATAYNVHRARVTARDDFERTLKQRLQEAHSINASVALTGDAHQRIRVGSGSFDEAIVETLVTQALKDELTGLGFERIVLAAPRQSWRTALEPRPESAYVADELVPFGLDTKLALNSK